MYTLSIDSRFLKRILKYLTLALLGKIDVFLDTFVSRGSVYDTRGEGLLFNPTNQASFGTAVPTLRSGNDVMG